MGFWGKIAKKSLKSALSTPKKKSPPKEPRWSDKDCSFNMNGDDWLKGKDLTDTGIYHKHPEVQKRAFKELIELTIEAHGAFELDYGKDFMESGEFFPLTVDNEKVACRELFNSYNGDAENPPKKTFRLNKIALRQYVPVVDEQIYNENLKLIKETIEKKGVFSMFGYTNEKGIYNDEKFCESTPLRIDEEFLYLKKPRGKKEEKIRHKWIEEVDYEPENDQW